VQLKTLPRSTTLLITDKRILPPTLFITHTQRIPVRVGHSISNNESLYIDLVGIGGFLVALET